MIFANTRIGSPVAESRITRFAAALVLLALLALPGCVNIAGAREDAELYQSINLGHLNDASLSPDARLIARDNADYWAVQAFTLGGDEPEPGVRERLAALAGVAPVGS